MSEAVARWLDRAPEGWCALLQDDVTASPALGADVWETFAATEPGVEARLLVVERDGVLLGGAPVLLEHRGPFRWLHALPMLLPGAPAARAGEHAQVDDLVARAIAALARELGIVGGEWSLYRPDGPAVAGDALTLVEGETRVFEASIVRLEAGLEGARRRMDRKHRQSLQHAGDRGFTFAEEPAALDDAYALHVAQGRLWGGHRALPLALSRRLLESSAARPVARLFTLRLAGELLSATLALDGPHETFVWWSGTHPRARRVDAFTFLMWSVIEWAAAHGRRRMNLGASTGLAQVASFKHALGAEGVRYPVRWLAASNASVPARAMAWLQARMRSRRARGATA